MIYKHTPEQILDYERIEAINQSGLKAILDDGIQKFIDERFSLQRDELYYEEKSHFIIGKGVDCNISHGKEYYESIYHISKLARKPGPKALSIVNNVFSKAVSQFPINSLIEFQHYTQEIFDACNEDEYYMKRAKNNPMDDTRYTSLLKEGAQEYWEELISSNGKQVLSDQEVYIIDKIYTSMTTHPNTAYLFRDSKDIDIVYQFPMTWIYDDVFCKGLTDHIRVDHANKLIIPLDEKTIGDYVLRFNKNFKRLRYDIQGSFYTFGLARNLVSLSNIVGRDVSQYRITKFAFVVESTVKPGYPMIFPMTENLLRIGEEGDGRYIYGWKKALGIYKSWLESGFDISERLKETNGVVFIDEFFEYPNID